jgi:uncharacterized delta-60 repeat protein
MKTVSRPLRSLLATLLAPTTALCLLAPPRATAQSPTADDFDPEPSGYGGLATEVYALALQSNGQILVGGSFSFLDSMSCWFLGRLWPDGSLDYNYQPGVNGVVYSLAVQPNAQVLLAGFFSVGANGFCLARLNQDGTLDTSFNPSLDGPAYSMAVQADGKILAGGDFQNLDGQACNYLGRLCPDGTLDTNFNTGADSTVNTLAIQADGKILVGGAFTNLAGVTHTNLGRLNTNGTVDTTFTLGANGPVNALAVQADGKILVGGAFGKLGGQTRTNLARLNADSSLDTNFVFGTDGAVYSLALQTDGKILVGGAFAALGGQPCGSLGRLNANGSVDTAFNPDSDPTVYSVVIQPDGAILAAGTFTTLGGQPRGNLGRLYNTTSATQSLSFASSTLTWLRGGASPEVWRTSFQSTTNGADWALLGPGARVTGGWELADLSLRTGTTVYAQGFVCGGYDNASSWFVEAYFGAPLFASQPASATNNAGDVVTLSAAAIATTPACSFRWLKQGVPLTDAGNVSGSATASLTLSNVLHADAANYTLVLSNAYGSRTSAVATLTVVDPFITAQPVNTIGDMGANVSLNVAALGTAPLAYQWWFNQTPLAAGAAATLTLTNFQSNQAGNYWVVVSNRWGLATSTVAQVTFNLATRDLSFNAGTSNVVNSIYALAVQPDGQIVVGGDFTALGGQPRNYLGRLNADGTVDNAFNPGAGGPIYPAVYCLALRPDTSIAVFGSFQTLGGQIRSNIALVSSSGVLSSEFDVGVWGYLPFIYAMAMQGDGKFVIGGFVPQLGALPLSNLGRLNADGTVDTSFIVEFDTFVYSLAMQTNGQIVIGGGFTNLWQPGMPQAGVTHCFSARVNANGADDASFNAASDGGVYVVAVQPDQKILIGGDFWMVGGFCGSGGQSHRSLARLYPDSSTDTGFNPEVDGAVETLALQADGKIIVGGSFSGLDGQPRYNLGRLNPDGTLDTDFNAATDGEVDSLAVEADGKILVGGAFANLCGQPCGNIGRLNNTEPVTNTLSYTNSIITWLCGGASPEVWRTTFEVSTDGVNWTSLGNGTRIAGGWQLADINVPTDATIRARGYALGGLHNASTWFVQTLATNGPARPQIARDAQFGFGANGFGFDLSGTAGQVVVVECSTNLVNWLPLRTNTLGAGPWYFSDPAAKSKGIGHKFYRGRVAQ